MCFNLSLKAFKGQDEGLVKARNRVGWFSTKLLLKRQSFESHSPRFVNSPSLNYDQAMTKIAIIGGGAAGMMAAASLVEAMSETKRAKTETGEEEKLDVFLIERNPGLGHKVIISGGGRCNVTTGLKDMKLLLKAYPRGAKFVRTAMHAFPPWELMNWVEERGVKLKTEEDLRVFPRSNKGVHIVNLFEQLISKSRAEIRYRCALETIEKTADGFLLTLSGGETLLADKVILTTGGQAYRHTGSQGDGYSFAEALGHSITALAPSLSAYRIEEKWVTTLAGLSFENVRLKLAGSEKNEFTGAVLFTHKGVTGPGIFALSSLAAYEVLEKNRSANLFVDFFPDTSYEDLRAMIDAKLLAAPNKLFSKHFGLYGS